MNSGGEKMSQVVYAPLDAIHTSRYKGLRIKGRTMEAVTRKRGSKSWIRNFEKLASTILRRCPPTADSIIRQRKR